MTPNGCPSWAGGGTAVAAATGGAHLKIRREAVLTANADPSDMTLFLDLLPRHRR